MGSNHRQCARRQSRCVPVRGCNAALHDPLSWVRLLSRSRAAAPVPEYGSTERRTCPVRKRDVLIAAGTGLASAAVSGIEYVQTDARASAAVSSGAAAGKRLIVCTGTAVSALRDAAANVGVTYNVHASTSFTHSGQPTTFPHRSRSSLSVSASHTGQRGQVYSGGSTGGSIVRCRIMPPQAPRRPHGKPTRPARCR